MRSRFLRHSATILALLVLVALSCHDSITLPPVQGPPLRVPEEASVVRAQQAAARPLEIIHFSPQGTLRTPQAQLTVSFNKPLVALEHVEGQAQLAPLVLDPPLAGTQRWLGSRTLLFEPARAWPGSTTFAAKIPRGLRALDGSTLAKEQTWQFTTARLAVARMEPAAGERWLTPDATITLFFNQPVNPRTLEQHVALLVSSGSSSQTITTQVRQGKNAREMVLHPATALPKGASIVVQLDAEMRGLEGPLPLEKAFRGELHTYGPFQVLGLSCTESCDPDESIRLRFSNPFWARHTPHPAAQQIEKQVRQAVRLNGRVATRAWVCFGGSNELCLSQKFPARSRFVVTVDPRLRDHFGQTLQPLARPIAFTTGDYTPYAQLPVQTGVLEAKGPRRLPLYFRNVQSAKLRSKPLSFAELSTLLAHPDYWDETKPLVSGLAGHRSEELQVAGAPNTRVSRRIDLGALVGTRGRGMLALELESRFQPQRGEQGTDVQRVIVRITDLALTAKYAPSSSLIWVTSLSSGQPVADCEVSIGQLGKTTPLWQGKTDEAGLVAAPGITQLAAKNQGRQLIFFARSGSDESYVLASTQSGISPWDFNLEGSWEDREGSLRGLLFTDRGIYRPGERVYVKGILRRSSPQGLALPEQGPLKLTVSDSRGEQLQALERSLSAFGSFAWQLQLPAAAPLGSYSIVGKLPGGGAVYGSFRVEEYRPADFQVSVQAERQQYVRGDTLAWKAAGDYLFGAPMRKAEVSWALNQSRTAFSPPEHEGYVFSDEIDWWREQENTSELPLVARGSDKLDREGRLAQQTPLRPPKMVGPLSYELEATVTDLSRQSISARTAVLLHPGEFYVGARPKETFLKAGERLQVELLAVTPAGRHLAGIPLLGTLYRRTWHSVRKQGMGGAHYFVTEPQDEVIARCQVTSANTPQRCELPVAQAGYYFLRTTGTDKRNNPVASAFEVYVSGSDYVAWRRDNENRVGLVLDRKQYRVGQVARVLIKSPYAQAHGLITVESSGILTRQPLKLSSTAAWIEVPVTKALVPNAYLSVVLVRGRMPGSAEPDAESDDPGRPAFKMGYAKLVVSQAEHHLQVKVQPARTTYRPGERVEVDLAVHDAHGRPVQGELAVFAADEGVLSLIGYKTPDPMATFYAERGLSVRTADNRIQLISRRVFGEKGKNPGGGGAEAGEEGGVRRAFVSTPYFDPSVLTDATGRAHVSFVLPDNLTTFRIMAVVASRGAEFGNGEGQIKVNKPLLLLSALPRLVRVGDRLEAGVVVHNQSARGGAVQVAVQARGLRLDGRGAQTLQLSGGESAEARFRFAASAPGEARLRFSARLEDEEDVLELRRPIQLPLVAEAVASYGSTTGAAAEGLMPGYGIRKDAGGLEVSVSSSALVGLKAGLEYLLDYGYECAEQSTSRLVPLVLLKDLTRAFGLGTSTKLDDLAARLIGNLEQLQRWDGGFAYWPSSSETYPWISAYVAWGLGQARAHGFAVSKQVLSRATGYLKEQIKQRLSEQGTARRVDLATRAFLGHVLVELGEDPAGYLANLYEQRAQLTTFSRALLLAALTRSKIDRGGELRRTLSNELLREVQQTARSAHVEENLGDDYAPLFHSDLRSSAMVLEALLRVQPTHPLAEKLVRYLLEQRHQGHFGNTQENVYSLLALDRYYQTHERVTPDFVARVQLGQQLLLSERFHGRSLISHQQQVPMSRLANEQSPLAFFAEGTGRLYYSAKLRYFRAELPTAPWDGGFYLTRTYERVPQAAGSVADLRGDPTRPSAGTLKFQAGDLVRVTLRLVAPQHASFVALEDPLPAGLEAINFQLMTAAQSLQQGRPAHGYQPAHSEERYLSSWATPFYHQEVRDDRVQLFADEVMPGIHSYTYLARATTIGHFVAPPAHIEQMYEPEVFGRTGTVTVEVGSR